MNHMEFIEKNVRSELLKQGFSASLAQGGAVQAVDLYKRMSQASKRGAMFDDCLRHAKLWAEKNGLPDEKPQKRQRRATSASPSLF